MKTLTLIDAQDSDTPLHEIMHPFDRYSLALELEDAGMPFPWSAVLAWETCGDVKQAVGDLGVLVGEHA